MRTKQRTNVLWGLVLVAVAVVILLNALQMIPESVFDLLVRAWPALLVMLGLSIVLRPRVPLGSLLALVVSAGLVVAVVSVAFSSRAAQQREDYQEPVIQPISESVTLLRLQIQALTTDVELLRRVGDDRVITGQFVGSTESDVEVSYEEAEGVADLRVIEQQVNQLPMLENVGRGTLRLELPANLPVDINLQTADGDAVLNIGGIALERLNLDLRQGDALVTLPVYQPLASARGEMLGTLAVRNGDITLFIDPALAAHLELNLDGSGIEPVYDATTYNYLVGNVLEARNIDSAEMAVYYTVTVPRGQVTVRPPLSE